jgi:hypothetical protein
LGEIARKHCDRALPEIERTFEAAAGDANTEVREEARLALRPAANGGPRS